MKKTYIVLLNNNYLLFSNDQPKKKGNFLQGVKLFETKKSTSCSDICKWIEKQYKSKEISEVADWE